AATRSIASRSHRAGRDRASSPPGSSTSDAERRSRSAMRASAFAPSASTGRRRAPGRAGTPAAVSAAIAFPTAVGPGGASTRTRSTAAPRRGPRRGFAGAAAGPSQRFGGATAGRMVALTFDDGPSIYTPQVLAILNHYRVHATFFEIG